MLLLVMGDNLALMFFGWEGVGLCSYLLIGFWYTRPREGRRRHEGLRGQPHRRLRLPGRPAPALLGLARRLGSRARAGGRCRGGDHAGAGAAGLPAAGGAGAAQAEARQRGPRRRAPGGRPHPQLPRAARPGGRRGHRRGGAAEGASASAPSRSSPSSACCSSSAPWARAPSSRSTSGCPTPWPAPRRSPPSSTPPPWSPPASTWWRGSASSSRSPPSAMAWVALVGALTALFAASIGLFQYDIKKVLAYSTVSQLGFMFIGRGGGRLLGRRLPPAHPRLLQGGALPRLGLGDPGLPPRAGHAEDGRAARSSCRSPAGPTSSPAGPSPASRWRAASTPRTRSSGRPSPPATSRSSASPTPWLGPAIWAAGLVAATGTSFYMFRSYYMTFTGSWRGGRGHAGEHGEDPHAAVASPHHADPLGHHDAHPAPDPAHPLGPHLPHESPRTITLVLVALAVGAVLASLLGLPHAWTGQEPLLEQWLAPSVAHGELPPPARTGSSSACRRPGWAWRSLGWGLAFARSTRTARAPCRRGSRRASSAPGQVVYDKYYVDELYDATAVRGTLGLARLSSWCDERLIDGLVNAAAAVTRGFAGIDACDRPRLRRRRRERGGGADRAERARPAPAPDRPHPDLPLRRAGGRRRPRPARLPHPLTSRRGAPRPP